MGVKDIKYVIFDYNGTLVDDVGIALKACNHMFKIYGVPHISLEQFRNTFTVPWIEFYMSNEVKEHQIDIEKHQKEYNKIDTRLRNQGLNLHKNAKDTLDLLADKNIALGLLSSRNTKDLMTEVDSLGVAKYFDTIVGAEDINKDGTTRMKKGNKIIKEMKIKNPPEVLYVGDMVTDIINSRELGFLVGVISGGWQSDDKLKSENPDYFFNSYKELMRLFLDA